MQRLYPGRYLELFARKEREGWTTCGNEIKPAEFQEEGTLSSEKFCIFQHVGESFRHPLTIECPAFNENPRRGPVSSPGAPKGNKNALKHGVYTAEAIARRRVMSEWVRAMRALARNH